MSESRMYTIPGGVQKEAKKSLEWHKEYHRGGTPVGLNTARTLAKGGQIGIEKIRHIAKYFPRHEVDKKGKGWAPGQEHFPSNGRIAWALWGGDAGQRWASSIVERENKKQATTASADMYSEDVLSETNELDAFKTAHELDPHMGPEFMARIRLDDSGIDRLYKIEVDGQVYIWDGAAWEDMGHVDGDVYSYDAALDDPYDACEKTHVLIDPSSAVVISAFLQERPFQPVTLDEIDPEETALMFGGLQEEDFSTIDRVMTAAGEPLPSKADQNGDGKLDTKFLSEKASSQPRNADGEFVKVGSRTVVAGDKARGSGVLESIDYENNKVNVKLDSGKTISVDPKYTQAEENVQDNGQDQTSPISDINLDGILADPNKSSTEPKAFLPAGLEPMDPADLEKLLKTYPAAVAKFRLEANSVEPVSAAGAPVAPEDQINSPEESDFPAKYLAIVAPTDHSAVFDLAALVPASKTSTEPVTYVRKDQQWVKDEQILMDLRSASPPTIVPLDNKEQLNSVLLQIDGKQEIQASAYEFSMFWGRVVEPLLAAGGFDRNRGNAEELRQYWTRGKGALKIRWGTPGDWTRCVRHLSKYMGPRAKGYCQLRHKEATGVYTGSKLNPGHKNRAFTALENLYVSEEAFNSTMIEKSRLAALAADAREKIGLVASVRSESGAEFTIPMLVPEGVESGDGRKFEDGAISVRELPVPLLWQIKTGAGHDGSVVVGRIDYIERIDGGMGNARGVFDNGPYGKEAERLVRYGFLRGVSVDLDQFEAKEDKAPRTENAEDGDVMGKDKLTINKARIMAATIVAKPAFQECSILLQAKGDQEENMTPEDGIYEESMADFADVEPMVASGFLKSDIPLTPPSDWFDNPKLTKATPLTVDDDGRVYGHIAAWNVNHIGLPRATKPPRSRSKYAYFHTGVLRTDSGNDVPVGQLTLAGGHAPLNVDAMSAAKHYDDTASAVADIHVGEDEYGIWCAGSLRPNLEELQIRALRASAPSGDWRPINGALELVAICQVNVPGFPTARAMVASGKVLALVAAGASYLAMMKCSGVACALATKADMLGELAATAPDLKLRVREAKKALRSANLQALTASADDLRQRAIIAAAVAEMAKFSDEERKHLAREGAAMDNGSFPIRNVDDLKNAIHAYGRANKEDRAAVRKHIIKRARKLGASDLVPDEWKTAASAEAAAKVASMRAAITAAAEIEVVAEASAKDLAAQSDYSLAVVAAAPKVEEISDSELKKLKDAKAEADKQTEEEIARAEEIKKNGGKNTPSVEINPDTGEAAPTDGDIDPDTGLPKFVSGVNQPRDAKGKYRTVLARLKQNLGVAGLADALKKAESAENMDFAGDYEASVGASMDLLDMVDRLDSGALNAKALENVRLTAADLGKTIANLPLPFGKEADKIKFSDLPTGLKDLIDSMITRVEGKIGKKDADVATQDLKSYMSGADLYSQSEVQSQMSKLLRLLT